MKTPFALCLLAFVMSIGADAQDYVREVSEETPGKIMFMRATGYMGSASAIRVFIDEEFVCKLSNNKYSLHEVPPGTHVCSAQFGGKTSKDKAEQFEVDVQPGETVYMTLVLETGVMTNKVYTEEVTPRTAERKLARLEQDVKYH